MTFEQIAKLALGPSAIADSALDMAALLLVDTLGVAAGAAALEPGQIIRDHVVRFHSAVDAKDRATLLFDGRQASIVGAALAAATQIDNLDAHDGYNPTKGHIGCAVVPALFAFAQSRPDLTAREALAALVWSYEISARAAIALHATVSDYHTSGAWNGLGVAALGCRLMGADAEQLRHALGIAEYHGPRSQMMREIANPTMLHDGSGMGAMVGAMAALQAMAGFTGAPAITVTGPEVSHFWQDLGQVWTIEQNYIKPYPICRWAHASLDATAKVMAEHDIVAGDIARIEVNTFAQAAALYADMPKTTSQAQYSLPFALAALVVNGQLGPEQITGAGLRDEKVAHMLRCIDVREEPRHSARFPLGRWSDVVVHTADGRALRSGDVHARGGPEAPMALAEVETKFHIMTAAMQPTRAKALWSMRQRLLSPDAKFAEIADLVADPIQM